MHRADCEIGVVEVRPTVRTLDEGINTNYLGASVNQGPAGIAGFQLCVDLNPLRFRVLREAFPLSYAIHNPGGDIPAQSRVAPRPHVITE
jgi:hypothetical protein